VGVLLSVTAPSATISGGRPSSSDGESLPGVGAAPLLREGFAQLRESPGGRVGEPFPGVGEAPLPPVGSAQLRESPGGRVGEPLPGVGEAPLPPVGFAQLREFNEAQVVEWLDQIGYCAEFTTIDVATNKQEFLELDLSGSLLLDRCFNINLLWKVLSLGKAWRLYLIIEKVYHDAGIFPPSFTKTTVLTITQVFSCQVRPQM